ncbi:peptidylprolyl isomerase fpr3 [Coemansia sp. RSA 2049]|nr:peptidylprolyl isomerase fpr3 [Coemansia sp. RSA 2049]KAJ2617084.1 peptidylprolyl isomerase fpr3 [Coemansia sp. RSA 1804]
MTAGFRGFWALKIVPGHTYTQTVDASFRAALGLTLADDQRTSVVATVDGKDFVLCSLTPGKIEQQTLDLWMTEGEEITFETNGNNEVHLTGNFIIDEEEDDEKGPCEYDLPGLSSEELQDMVAEGLIDPVRLLELASDEDEDDDEEEDDSDYDSEDADMDGRITEITEEASSSDEEEKAAPVKELKIKKQAEKKKRKEAADEEEEAKASAKKAKKGEKEEKKAEPKTVTTKLQGGVIAEIKQEGTGAGAKKGARVGMHYIGKLTNGKVFDKNVKGKPFWFRLGAGEVIKGWDVGILGMKKGGERRLTIPAAMAYGKRGAPPDIPANATLVFDIRLIDFK